MLEASIHIMINFIPKNAPFLINWSSKLKQHKTFQKYVYSIFGLRPFVHYENLNTSFLSKQNKIA